ncbi:MAG: SIMPL domain-containing protein, partial [Pyrinomonadaceae bacterium]|nr:SIMPL domain-containing protein [Pyrinomonadaceae bacterium]
NVSFTLREKNAAQGSTLAQATQQAMAKAEGIANALNGKIVRIVETREGGVVSNNQTEAEDYKNAGVPNASSMLYRSAPKPTYTTPVEAGSLNVRSQVVLVVEIAVNRL